MRQGRGRFPWPQSLYSKFRANTLAYEALVAGLRKRNRERSSARNGAGGEALTGFSIQDTVSSCGDNQPSSGAPSSPARGVSRTGGSHFQRSFLKVATSGGFCRRRVLLRECRLSGVLVLGVPGQQM